MPRIIDTADLDPADLQAARDIRNYVYAFTHSALPDALADKLNLRFKSVARDDYDAQVHMSARGGGAENYDIRVFDGLTDGLYMSLVKLHSSDPDKTFVNPDERRILGVDESEKILNIVLLFSFCFISFHELAHIISGHLELCRSRRGAVFRFARVSYSEVRGFSVRGGAALGPDSTHQIPETILSKLIELEADTLAIEYLTELTADIANMLFEDEFIERIKGDLSAYAVLDALMLSGVALTFILLEMARQENGVDTDDYPLPATRLLNVCGAMINYVIRDAQAAPDRKTTRATATELSDAEAIAFYCAQTCLPALAFARKTAQAIKGDAALRAMGLEEFAPESGFLADMMGIFASEKTQYTSAGEKIAELNQHSESYRAILAGFRKQDWWRG